MRKSLTAMKKLQMICNDTNNPNFAANYQNGVMDLLKESIVKSGNKDQDSETKKPKISTDVALERIKNEVVKLHETTQIKEDCARVEAKRWDGVSESKFQYQRGREIMAHNISNKCEQIIKKIDNIINNL